MYRPSFVSVEGSYIASDVDAEEVKVVTFYDATKVTFGDIDDETIRAYIATGEPMDKVRSRYLGC